MTTQTMPSHAEIQAERRKFIGGSDAAAVMGLSRYKTPLQLWAEKTGKIIPEDRSDALPIRLGHRLEQVVAELFMEETGKKVRRVPERRIHKAFPFICAQIDRVVEKEDADLECKTASGWKADEWEGAEIPQEYFMQCFHDLAVTGKDVHYIACLIGGNQDFAWKPVERDEAVIKELLEREDEFWRKYVIPGVPPPVSADDADTLYALHPKGDLAEAVELNDNLEKTINRYKEIGADGSGLLGALKEEKELLGNQLREALGDNALGILGKWNVSWKNQSTGTRLDTKLIQAEAPELYAKYGKTGETRVLRVAEFKPKKGGK